jgi:DNA-binding XRE family transcriptional regulator
MAGAAITVESSAESNNPSASNPRQTATGSQTGSQLARDTVRCYQCKLVQYIPVDRNCRRCHHPLDPPPIQFPITVPTIKPIPTPCTPRSSASHQQLFINIDRALPVVMFWLRVRRGLSQNQLAAILHVPRTYLSKIESGASLPTVESVIKISGALGVDIRMVMKSVEILMRK